MAEPTETIKKIKLGLEPFIKPREQVNYIRRVLALHLGACCGHDGPIRHPLSLADSSRVVEPSAGLTGHFREYVEALQANIVARRQLDDLLRASLSPAEPEPTIPPEQQQQQPLRATRSPIGADLLEERICLLKYSQKLRSLHAVRQSLDALMEKPAAMEGFLDAKRIFEGSLRMPHAPEELGDVRVVDQDAPKINLAGQVQQLEKTVLRARLKLKQEEHALENARAKCKAQHEAVNGSSSGDTNSSSGSSSSITSSMRYSALQATRDELTRWIETELSKVPPELVERRRNGGGSDSRSRVLRDGAATLSSKLDEISGKYSKYVLMRKTLLDLAAHKPQPSLLAPSHFALSTSSGSDKPPSAPVGFLITPYLEIIIAVSSQQRALMGHKTSMTAALGKESQETCQVLGHLGEESQLLLKYPMKDSLRRRSGIQHEIAMRSSEQPDISERIKPWVFAADSAKITTLETVAETVEGGQVALESALSLLQDIDVLLGREEDPDEEQANAGAEKGANREEEEKEGAQGEGKRGRLDEDGWHLSRRLGADARASSEWGKQMAKKTKKKPWSSQDEKDVWSKFHGDLSLQGN